MNKNLKIVFFGTPEFVVPIVDAIYKRLSTSLDKSVIGVVTQPPKQAGRKKLLTYSAIDKWAFNKKITIHHAAADAPSADLAVVAAYGEIIPKSIIKKYKYGILNIHPSLLPKWRGASPVAASIIANENPTGVTILLVDEQMDHGPVISQFKDKILADDTNDSLRNRLFERAAEFLINLIPNYLNGKIKINTQDHYKATYCKRLTKQDGFIKPEYFKAALNGNKLSKKIKIEFMDGYELSVNSVNIERFIRAMYSWPVAWTKVKINSELKIIKIYKAHIVGDKLVPDEVQLEGKNKVSWKQFLEGYPEAKFGQ
jgi:methionyl-tRNA formyltransferase